MADRPEADVNAREDDIGEDALNHLALQQHSDTQDDEHRGYTESETSSSIINLYPAGIEDVSMDTPVFTRDMDEIARAAETSDDMMKDFESLQTKMLEAVVSKRFEELKASLQSDHDSETSDLKFKLESMEHKIDTLKQKVRSERTDKQRIQVELEKSKAELAAESRRQEQLPIELTKAKDQIEVLIDWIATLEKTATTQQEQHTLELQKLREELRFSGHQYENDSTCFIALQQRIAELQNVLKQNNALAAESIEIARRDGYNAAKKEFDAKIKALHQTQIEELQQERMKERQTARQEYEQELESLRQARRNQILEIRAARKSGEAAAKKKFDQELLEIRQEHADEILQVRKEGEESVTRQGAGKRIFDEAPDATNRIHTNEIEEATKKGEIAATKKYENMLLSLRQNHAQEIAKARLKGYMKGRNKLGYLEADHHKRAPQETPSEEPIFEEGTLNQINVPIAEHEATIMTDEDISRGSIYNEEIMDQIAKPLTKYPTERTEMSASTSTTATSEQSHSNAIIDSSNTTSLSPLMSSSIEKEQLDDDSSEIFNIVSRRLTETDRRESVIPVPQTIRTSQMRTAESVPQKRASREMAEITFISSLSLLRHSEGRSPPSDTSKISGFDSVPPATAWFPAEDQRLISVRAQGMTWTDIQTEYFPERTLKACAGRWHRLKISGVISESTGSCSTNWAPADDRTLISARTQGSDWKDIQAQHFPNRTPDACKRRHWHLRHSRATAASDIQPP